MILIGPSRQARRPPALPRYYGINAALMPLSQPLSRQRCGIDAVIDRTQDGEDGIGQGSSGNTPDYLPYATSPAQK
jgi:hypothetical protein